MKSRTLIFSKISLLLLIYISLQTVLMAQVSVELGGQMGLSHVNQKINRLQGLVSEDELRRKTSNWTRGCIVRLIVPTKNPSLHFAFHTGYQSYDFGMVRSFESEGLGIRKLDSKHDYRWHQMYFGSGLGLDFFRKERSNFFARLNVSLSSFIADDLSVSTQYFTYLEEGVRQLDYFKRYSYIDESALFSKIGIHVNAQIGYMYRLGRHHLSIYLSPEWMYIDPGKESVFLLNVGLGFRI
jgi:hypothetical protein